MAQYHTNKSGTVDTDTPGPQTDHTPVPSRPLDPNFIDAMNNALEVKQQLQSGGNVEPGQLRVLKATRSPRE